MCFAHQNGHTMNHIVRNFGYMRNNRAYRYLQENGKTTHAHALAHAHKTRKKREERNRNEAKSTGNIKTCDQN